MKKIILAGLALSMISCAHSTKNSIKFEDNQIVSTKIYTLKNPPLLGKTLAEQNVYLGGFSGLIFQAKEGNSFRFKTITDRGPNGWQIKTDRPFLLPDYSPTIFDLKTDDTNLEINVVGKIPLIKKNGKPMTGLPNKRDEENPVDVFGFTYSMDVDGLDTEGIVPDEEGGYWVAEEYAPSLVRINSEGKMMRRIFPAYELPRVYAERKTNRGFEAVTKIDTKVFGFLQSQLPIDKDFSRIVEFDLETYRTSAEYFYKIEDGADRVGDAVALPNKTMLVIEQNGKANEKSFKRIYQISLNASDELVTKHLLVDLNQTPFIKHEKVEGITVIDNKHIAVVNDNDFKISGETNFKTGITPMEGSESELMIIELEKSIF